MVNMPGTNESLAPALHTGRRIRTKEAVLLRPLHSAIIFTVVMIVSIGLWANITQTSTSYGTGGGQFADQVDSFSEYIIRNTVLNSLVGEENTRGSLIITKGYPKYDYNYYSDKTIKYHSHRGLQANAYEAIARINRELFLNHTEKFFQLFRFLNCWLVTLCAGIFFVHLVGSNILSVLAIISFSLMAGVALFASNLYFMLWMLFMPLMFYPLLERGQGRTYVFSAFMFSILYFSVRYEFATTFAFMWIFPVLVLRLKGAGGDKKTGLLAFSSVCIGFIIALFAHHVAVAAEMQTSIGDASTLILKSVGKRALSLDGVPAPLSPQFLDSMRYRWEQVAISIPYLFQITKFTFVIAFLIVALRIKDPAIRRLFAWALLAYASWYVFAYQHILWHSQYDSLLFAATIQMVLLVYVVFSLKMYLAKKN